MAELSATQEGDLRRMLIDVYPERAYDAFREAGDKKGLPLLIDSLTKKYNLPVEVIKTIVGW